jgi:hypothetical protein
MIRPLAQRVALSAALVVPATALAQGSQLTTNLSASVSQIYDANLFAAPSPVAPQSDVITRVGPAFDLEYRARTLTTTARYELQAERYLNHPTLTSNTSHQDAAIGLRYLPSKLLGINVTAGYVRTQTPSELNIESQLSFGRAPAERVSVNAAASYKVSRVTRLSGEYVFGRDRLIGVMSNASHRSRLGMQRSNGERNSYRVDYEFRNFETGVGVWSPSHVITAGWTHAFTKRSGLDIMAGPRLSEGTARAEVAAVLRHQASWGNCSFRYTRTEMTTFGELGAVEAQRIAIGAHYRPARWVSLTATPAFTTSARGRTRVPVSVMDIESAFDLTRRLSFVAWGRAGKQRGTLSGLPGVIPYRTFGVTVKIAPPRAAR